MRRFTRFVIWYAIAVGALAAFGLTVGALKVLHAHEAMGAIFGPHGILFGLVLPVMTFALVPILVIWIGFWTASLFRRKR